MLRQKRHSSLARCPSAASLQDNDTRLLTLDQAPVGLALTTLEGTWVWVNLRWCDLLGVPRGVLQGSLCFEWIAPVDRKVSRAQFAQLQAGEARICTAVIRYRRTDGGLVWIRVFSALVRVTTRAPRHTFQILEPLPTHPPHPAGDASLLTSGEPLPPLMSAQTSTLTSGAAKRAGSEWNGERQKIFPPFRPQQWQEYRVQYTLQGLRGMAEALVPVLDGQTMSAESPAVSTALAQRLAEVARAILDCQGVVVALMKRETGTLHPLAMVGFALQEAEQWWASWSRQIFENLLLLEQMQIDAILLQEAAVSPVCGGPHPFNNRQWLVVPLWVDTHLTGALVLDEGRAKHTSQRGEIALVQALARLGALLLEREHLLEEREETRIHTLALQESNQRLDTFLELVSHELKTPLTALALQVQVAQRRLQQTLAQRGMEPNEQAERLQAAATQLSHTGVQLARIERLMQAMLGNSCIQAGRLDLHLHLVDVPTLIQEGVEEQRQFDPTRRIDLQLATPGKGCVLADADRLRQVLTNYLTNALKYSPETTPVLVGVEQSPAEVRVWVRDQGPGLSLEQQVQIWERFYRVPGIAVQGGSEMGMGLGLYLSKTFIERLGGHVGVQSSPGGGSTFWFTLPLEQEDAGLR